MKKGEILMKTISVPDMMCENCVKRITDALTGAELKFQVSLDTKTVTIDGCEHCVKTAVSELEDLGFTPEVRD
jgi:copper chaperone CopZ